ncbi:MAG: hypothetical protein CMP34_01570 [Rickettsiales bacterium]|nr:hypothetical protein [Rickettsiales bacterium]
MIYKRFSKLYLIILIIFFFFNRINAESNEEFEGIIVSVNSEAITTFDLSERIKLVLKSLSLSDNIENRDSVRERVLDLLILEKIKKKEVTDANLEYSQEELITFTSSVYNFPKDEFDSFKKFVEEEGLDIDVILEQLSTELLWTKFSEQKFASKVTVNQEEVDKIIQRNKKKAGKTEFNYSEIFIENENADSWEDTEKRMNKILLLLKNGSSFEELAKRFSDGVTSENSGDVGWIIEDNLEKNIKNLLSKLKNGEIKAPVKTDNGFKIIRMNGKRKNSSGLGNKVSFLKISTFDKDSIKNLSFDINSCNSNFQDEPDEKYSITQIKDILSSEISEDFLTLIQETKVGEMTKEIEINGEISKLLICEKVRNEKVNPKERKKVENKLFSERYNQLSRTYISNLKKSANIKYINK